MIKLEVGKKYLSRKGYVVRISKYIPNPIDGFHYIGYSHSYTENGSYYDDGNISDKDLVKEITE